MKEQKKKRKRKEKDTGNCDLCGKSFELRHLVIDEGTENILCRYCRAEKKYCGCADDG